MFHFIEENVNNVCAYDTNNQLVASCHKNPEDWRNWEITMPSYAIANDTGDPILFQHCLASAWYDLTICQKFC